MNCLVEIRDPLTQGGYGNIPIGCNIRHGLTHQSIMSSMGMPDDHKDVIGWYMGRWGSANDISRLIQWYKPYFTNHFCICDGLCRYPRSVTDAFLYVCNIRDQPCYSRVHQRHSAWLVYYIWLNCQITNCSRSITVVKYSCIPIGSFGRHDALAATWPICSRQHYEVTQEIAVEHRWWTPDNRIAM